MFSNMAQNVKQVIVASQFRRHTCFGRIHTLTDAQTNISLNCNLDLVGHKINFPHWAPTSFYTDATTQ